MGRMHSKGKGMSGSALPYKRSAPSWLKITTPEVRLASQPLLQASLLVSSLTAVWAPVQITEHIVKLAKKGMLPSQIGVVLRDSHGVTQVNAVTGSKILRILKGQGLAPDIPEDLYHLIKKAVSMRKHMEANRKDRDSKFRLILVESRIHRLARYYKVRCCGSQQLPSCYVSDEQCSPQHVPRAEGEEVAAQLEVRVCHGLGARVIGVHTRACSSCSGSTAQGARQPHQLQPVWSQPAVAATGRQKYADSLASQAAHREGAGDRSYVLAIL